MGPFGQRSPSRDRRRVILVPRRGACPVLPRSLSAAAALAVWLFGCSSSPGPSYGASPAGTSTVSDPAQGAASIPACSSKPTTGTFPPDVAAVLHAKCQTCHSRPPINHAPFPLVTYEDTLQNDTLQPYPGVAIWRVMHAVIQPDGVPHMPFGNAPQLTSAEFQTLDDWLLDCATPVADGGDAGEAAGIDSAPPDGAAANDSAPDGAPGQDASVE